MRILNAELSDSSELTGVCGFLGFGEVVWASGPVGKNIKLVNFYLIF